MSRRSGEGGITEMVNITFDGQKVAAEEGSTILQVAGNLGVEIPTLCHVESLRP